MTTYTDPTKRHEFVLLFDVKNGNPNGDPDAGNLPRIDPETMHGLVTDVCIKRKIRDYFAGVIGKPIFIQSKTALNSLILKAFQEIGVPPAEIVLEDEEDENEEEEEKIDLVEWLQNKSEAGFSIEEVVESQEGDASRKLVYGGEATRAADISKLLSEGLDEDQKDFRKKLRDISNKIASDIKQKKTRITPEKRAKGQEQLCKDYSDIRMFGAVLSTGLNAGQVRGPIQITFARSIDPIQQLDLTITRQARTTAARMTTGSTEMGRKPIVPYGLYRAHGFFNPFLAKQTGVGEDDLKNLWEALENMFEFDRSASRGEMAVRGLWIFTHDNDKGKAPAHKLFELIHVDPCNGQSPRHFEDYQGKIQSPPVKIGEPQLLSEFSGVTITRLV